MSELAAPAGRVPELAYRRAADDIAARIGVGELPPGTRLRAERELAGHYTVAYGTIRRAMKELRARGLVISVHGRGTFVAANVTPGPRHRPGTGQLLIAEEQVGMSAWPIPVVKQPPAMACSRPIGKSQSAEIAGTDLTRHDRIRGAGYPQ